MSLHSFFSSAITVRIFCHFPTLIYNSFTRDFYLASLDFNTSYECQIPQAFFSYYASPKY